MVNPADEEPFGFSNLTGRPSGPIVRALGTFLPGIVEVQRQVEPYAAAWREANRTALTGGHPRWIALGDSMTQGIGASTPWLGWVGQLAATLPSEVDVINLSQSGGRVEDVIARQLPAWRALPPPPHGEIVTLLVGSNDLMSPRHRSLLGEAFAELLEQLPRGTIVSAVPSPGGPARAANDLIRAAEDAGTIRAVSGDRDAAAWRGRLAADRFHPNDAGYTMIAEIFTVAVHEALRTIVALEADTLLEPTPRPGSVTLGHGTGALRFHPHRPPGA